MLRNRLAEDRVHSHRQDLLRRRHALRNRLTAVAAARLIAIVRVVRHIEAVAAQLIAAIRRAVQVHRATARRLRAREAAIVRLHLAARIAVAATRVADSFKLKKQTLYETIIFDNSSIGGIDSLGAGTEHLWNTI